MKKHITPLVVVLALLANTAMAEDDCYVPMVNWQPREAVAKLAADKGWTVRRIKIDDGCYEVVGTDAEGRHIEVKIHPGTLAVMDIEHENDDGEAKDEQED